MTKLSEVVAAWDDALKRLHKATAAYEAAHAEETAARSRATNALNALNAIQKEMDRLDADLRAAMPRDSDWSRRLNERPKLIAQLYDPSVRVTRNGDNRSAATAQATAQNPTGD